MKIVLSRKGFDETNGGMPSPIFQRNDGTLGIYSLPIPLEQATCTYGDIRWNGGNLRDLIASLRRRRRIVLPDTPHLDPDLVRDALQSRDPGWRPIFGQSNGQETLLRNMGVTDPRENNGTRPLFLFFGWYREITERGGTYSYARNAPNIHAF